MAVAVNKAGPYFTGNTAISFRALQENFGGNTNNVKFSTYKRNTDVDETNPIMPDATENAAVPTTDSDLSASKLRDTIKEYYIVQTGSNTDFDISGQTWNSNLGKNIIKRAKIDGTCSASATSADGATFNATAYNMNIEVSGYIYGDGGAGGSANSGNGGDGGDALYVNNTSARTAESAKVKVKVNSNGRIWAGGGGGAGGFKGASGSNLACFFNSNYTFETYRGDARNPSRACNRTNCVSTREVSGVTGNYTSHNCDGQGNDRSRCRGNQERGQTCKEVYNKTCYYRHDFTVAAGTGGNGGNGGAGQGSNRTKADGNAGNAGNTNNCGANGNSSTGAKGNTGGAGGDWGAAGGNTTNANGGAAGRAIYKGNGNTYNVVGASANTVKGAY